MAEPGGARVPADPEPLPGRDKPIERVGLGSWVHTYDADGTGRWGQVTAIRSLTHASGRKATELHVADHAAREMWGVREWNNEVIRACTKSEAKRAGIGDAL